MKFSTRSMINLESSYFWQSPFAESIRWNAARAIGASSLAYENTATVSTAEIGMTFNTHRTKSSPRNRSRSEKRDQTARTVFARGDE